MFFPNTMQIPIASFGLGQCFSNLCFAKLLPMEGENISPLTVVTINKDIIGK